LFRTLKVQSGFLKIRFGFAILRTGNSRIELNKDLTFPDNVALFDVQSLDLSVGLSGDLHFVLRRYCPRSSQPHSERLGNHGCNLDPDGGTIRFEHCHRMNRNMHKRIIE
jgi:hypothetical protein